MNRSKKIFLALALVFLTIVGYVAYDFNRRTTFPGSKSQLKERIKKQFLEKDSVKRDTSHATHRP